MKSINYILDWFTPYDALKKVKPLQVYLFQFLSFSIAFYVLLSWDFSLVHVVGAEELLTDTRSMLYFVWKRPFYYYSSGLFVYNWFDLDLLSSIRFFQYLAVGGTFFGLIGVFPRIAARISFISCVHISSLFILLNNTMDGSTTVLCASLLVLSISPKKNFYYLKHALTKPKTPDATSSDKGDKAFWPIYLIWMVFVAYYFGSGINKFVEYGPYWPHWLDMSAKAANNLQVDIFYSSYKSNLWVSEFLAHKWIGLLSSYHTLAIELLAPLILFRFRFRTVFVLFFPILHIGINLIMGYNYFLCAWIALILIDWEQIVGMVTKSIQPTKN